MKELMSILVIPLLYSWLLDRIYDVGEAFEVIPVEESILFSYRK